MYYNFEWKTYKNMNYLSSVEFPDWMDFDFHDSPSTLLDVIQAELDDFLMQRLNKTNGRVPVPQDVEDSEKMIYVRIRPELAFAILLRNYRMGNEITSTGMGKRLMMDPIRYKAIEQGRNITVDLIDKVVNMFDGFPVEEIFS